jgi:SAM-dependent methyltransferase
VPTDSWTPTGYQKRAQPDYAHQPSDSPKQWQPDVYVAAAALAQSLAAPRVIDVGCGNGSKTIELARACPKASTIGIDLGANLARARTAAPALDWREHDLQSAEPLPVSPAELAGAIVINADVIEHLPDPHKLLAMFARALPDVAAILMSTPERQLTRGLRDLGPPSNPAHIQEWTAREFGALLRESGLGSHSLGLIRAHDHSDRVATMFIAIAPTAARLRAVDELLVDLEIPASKGRLNVVDALRALFGR